MKKLILMRHAKSDWSQENLSDHERILNQRGKRDIPLMASILIQKYPNPQLILSSDSVRTTETVEGITKLGFRHGRVQFTHNLYLASITDIQNELATVPHDVETVLVCAHNPGISDYLNAICPDNSFQMFPTLGTALVVLDIESWDEIFTAKNNRLVRFDYPKKK